MTTEEDRKCHDRVALSDLIARLVDEVGSVPDMYASDHDRLVAVMGQITRHVWPEARGTLVPFGLDAENVSLRPVLARIDQLTDAIDTIARMHGEVGNLRAELETTRALNEELRNQQRKTEALLNESVSQRAALNEELRKQERNRLHLDAALTEARTKLADALRDCARNERLLGAEKRRKPNANERRATKVTIKTTTMASPKKAHP